MYLGEIAPKNYRGAIGIVPQLFITVGILVAQVFGIRNILGNKQGNFTEHGIFVDFFMKWSSIAVLL